MKRKFVTEFKWDPCLASNDNMLGYITTDTGYHIWLHKVRITRSGSEKTARLELDFYRVNRYVAETDFFKDYKAMSGTLIFDQDTEIERRLRLLERELQSEILAAESFGNTIHFNLPLLGKNFTRRAMEAVGKISVILTNQRDAWIRNFKAIQRNTEVFDASKGWIPLEEHILSKHGYE